jgi:hypothetical protein
MKIKKQNIDKFLLENSRVLLKEFDNLNIHSGYDKDVCDGLVIWHSEPNVYKKITSEDAERIGMKVLNYLIDNQEFSIKKLMKRYGGDFTEEGSFFDDAKIRNSNSYMPQTSYFEVGVDGLEHSSNINYSRITAEEAYQMWLKRIGEIALVSGWEFVNYMGADKSVKQMINKNTIKENNTTHNVGDLVGDAILQWHSKPEEYKAMSAHKAADLGMTVLNYLIGNQEFPIKKLDSRYGGDFTEGGSYYYDEKKDIYVAMNTDASGKKYKPQASFFSVGEKNAPPGSGTINYKDLKGHPAYNMWINRIKSIALFTGWRFVDWLGAQQAIGDSEEKPMIPKRPKEDDVTLPLEDIKENKLIKLIDGIIIKNLKG